MDGIQRQAISKSISPPGRCPVNGHLLWEQDKKLSHVTAPSQLEKGGNLQPINLTDLKELANQSAWFFLGPRAGRVVFNIQDGFRICEFRGVLCTKRCRSFSLFFYFVVDSVGVISVDIYSNSVSDNLLQYLQSWAIQYGSLDSCHEFWFVVHSLICHCTCVLEKYTSINLLTLLIIKKFQGFQSWR